jgi:hypothetical protein
MNTEWVGPFCASDHISIGTVHFLTFMYFHNSDEHRFDLRDKPARSIHSQKPTLVGSCGGFKNVSLEARGLVRVIRVCKNGRALVRKLEGAELATALDSLGWPQLAREADEHVPFFQLLDAMSVIERSGVLELADEFRTPSQIKAVRDYAELAVKWEATDDEEYLPARLAKIAASYQDDANPESCYP